LAGGGVLALTRIAATLKRRAGARKTLPGLLFFTDPVRTPDPEAIAERLPAGAAIVYRPFGADDAAGRGRRLAEVARRRGLLLLVGADPALAAALGADGVHLPQRLAHLARRLKAARPGWRVTAAAHDLASARAAVRGGADAVVLSAVFASLSPSAGPPWGPVRFAAMARGLGAPVYALGGVNARTARRLLSSGAAGLAAIEAFRT
jgi:thiamine-phosphate pyrophosphorylase